MNELMEILKMLGEKPNDDINLIAPYLKEIKLKANEYFLHKGKIGREVAFIKKGSMRAFYEKSDGSEINLLLKIERELIADYESFITGESAKYSIQALEDTEVIVLSREQLLKLSQESIFWSTLSRKIAEQNYLSAKRRAEELLFLSPQERYEAVMKFTPYFFQRFSLKHISAYLGIQQPSLSRIRAKK